MKYWILLLAGAAFLRAETPAPGIFEGTCDVGSPALAGSATYDPAAARYTVSGAGANMWAASDQFHFVWRKVAGDFSLTATVRFPKPGAAPHRKAGLMARRSLDADSAYIDAVVHGSGLTALQFREKKGGDTSGVRFPIERPTRIRLERRGGWFTMYAAKAGEPLRALGAYAVKLGGPVYLGLLVCSHKADVVETAEFSEVGLRKLPKEAGPKPDVPAAADADWKEPLPLGGLAQVTVEAADLDKARDFYTRVVGLEEAFDTKTEDGSFDAAYFKVNDRQFVEIRQGRKGWQSMWHFALQTKDIGRLRAMLVDRGLEPTDIMLRPDGNRSFRLPALPGQQLKYIEFLQYEPGSLSERTAGRFLGPGRLSTHLEHVGIIVTDFDAAYRFFKDLGFKDRYMRLTYDQSKDVLDQLYIPGADMEFVELFNYGGSPLPITHRVARGAVHFALTVPDDMAVYKETLSRGLRGRRPPPRFAWDNRYNVNIYDPDGTRVEFMQVEDPQRPTPLVVYTPKARVP